MMLDQGGNSRSRGSAQILDMFERKPEEYFDRLDMYYRIKKNVKDYIKVYGISNEKNGITLY